MSFEVVFQDEDVLVIEKAAGLLSQGDESGDDNLVSEVGKKLGLSFVGLVHRLDRNTSGLMVLGKNPGAAKSLTDRIQAGELLRRYQALLLGEVAESFEWQHHLEKNPKQNHVTVFRRPSAKSKEARLHGRRLSLYKIGQQKASLVEVELETGRSHQIRAQAAFEKHPVLGDRRYGGKLLGDLQQLARPALHSSYLSFKSPKSQEILEFSSALDLKPFPLEPL